MRQLIHYTSCPVCDSSSFEPVLSVKDNTVSKEYFTIAECKECSFRFTQDVPNQLCIAPYYKADSYISHTDTSKGLINTVYKIVRNYTLRKKRKLIVSTLQKKRGVLLDVGAGTGAFASEMKKADWQVTGLEPDDDARNIAKAINKVSLQPITNFYTLPSNSFDAITMWHVLEHVHDLNNYIAKLKELLKKDGRLFVAVPNYTSIDAEIYAAHWAAYDVPRHLYHFSPKAMNTLMEKHGLQIESYKPMWFDSFYIAMLSSKYKAGKTKLFSAFWNGLRSNAKAMGNVKLCSSIIYVVSRR